MFFIDLDLLKESEEVQSEIKKYNRNKGLCRLTKQQNLNEDNLLHFGNQTDRRQNDSMFKENSNLANY